MTFTLVTILYFLSFFQHPCPGRMYVHVLAVCKPVALETVYSAGLNEHPDLVLFSFQTHTCNHDTHKGIGNSQALEIVL